MAGKFEISKTGNGEFKFNLKASNGQVILTSESYKQKASAMNGIESVKKNAGSDSNYERKTSKSGQPYFVLKAANKQIISTSQMYSSASAREGGIKSVTTNAPGADVADLTT